MANFFVNEAKKSFHVFPTKEVKYDYMIYKYTPFHSAGKYKKSTLRFFEQVYLFEWRKMLYISKGWKFNI